MKNCIIVIDYTFLAGCDATYAGMARTYRSYQLGRGAVRPLAERMRVQPELGRAIEILAAALTLISPSGGESFPCDGEGVAAYDRLAGEIRSYVVRGGHWIECGGLPFCRAPMLARAGFDVCGGEDDGAVEATFGDVAVAVNLGEEPRTVSGKRLAPYGWFVTAPGLESTALEGSEPVIVLNGKTTMEVFAK